LDKILIPKSSKKMWKHLQKEDRLEISILYNKWYKQCDIVRELWIKKDIVSKEIKRNSVVNQESWEREYHWKKAQHKHYVRRRNAKWQWMKIDSHTPLKLYVIDKLKNKISPKVIAHSWNENHSKDHPNTITITGESIYQWLETGDGNKYKKPLLHQHTWYKKKKNKSKKVIIPHRVGIENRPLSIWERSEQGHFEADLIVSKKWYRWVLLTLIDRKSRKAHMIKLKSKKTLPVMKEIQRMKGKLWIKSVTFDNGREFAHHYILREYWINTYFCDTYASWQKGSIENYNWIVRRYFPKWTIFNDVSHNKIRSVLNTINNTPREILWFKSPNQVHN